MHAVASGRPRVELLDCPIQPYGWGSRTAIARLQGRPAADGPEAELWVGAHHRAPSRLAGGPTLLDRIAGDPAGELGRPVVDRFGPVLPFLLKVLGVATPLSLQAHPDRAQAERGHRAEDERGIPLDAPDRNYKDTWPKPELLVALTPFTALCGFRDPAAAARYLDALDVPALRPPADRLHAGGRGALGDEVAALLRWPAAELPEVVAQVGAAAARLADRGDTPSRWIAGLAGDCPGDPGVLATLLLNLVELAPGEGICLPPGNLHAYLGGTGVEVMANSDNVLRGGLTTKHVDVDELLRVLDFAAGEVPVLRPVCEGPELVYQVPFEEFRLSALDLGERPVTLDRRGPQLLLAVAGSVTARAGAAELTIGGGCAAYVGAGAPAVVVTGPGALFRATVGM